MMNQRGLYGAVPLAHFFLKERLRPGDSVVDATCGNGQDTLFLAGSVGSAGHIWAFDIQAEALAMTGEKLAAAGFESRVRLVQAGHERLAEFVKEPLHAVIFNLGYLPTGDREIVTTAETTIAALQQAKALLLPGGFILVAVYTGHAGGGKRMGRGAEMVCSAFAARIQCLAGQAAEPGGDGAVSGDC